MAMSQSLLDKINAFKNKANQIPDEVLDRYKPRNRGLIRKPSYQDIPEFRNLPDYHNPNEVIDPKKVIKNMPYRFNPNEPIDMSGYREL